MALASAADSTQLTGIVLTNDRTVDSTSNEAIIKGIIKEGMTEQQSAIALWRFFIQRNMHKETPPVEEWGNAAELMTKYGYAICGTWARMYAELATDAGMPASPVDLSGHVVATAKYWGDWHTFDADMWALYPTADGVIASPSDIRHKKDANGKYVLREGAPIKSYPWYAGPDTLSGIVSLYEKASWGDPLAKHNWKWNYDLRLRPGMEISWSWYGDPEVGFVSITHCPEVRSAKVFKSLRDYIADTFDYYQQKEGKPKWTWGYRRGGLNPNPLQPWNGVCGNGRLTFDLGANGCANALAMMESSDNLQVKDGKLCLTDPAKGEDVIHAFMTKNPDLDAVYVTWAEPAEFVLAALRNSGNSHTKIVTLDLSEPLALDMVKGGNVVAIVADEAYAIGATLARAAAASLIGKKLEPFYAVDAIAVTKDNTKDGWFKSLHKDPPATLTGG